MEMQQATSIENDDFHQFDMSSDAKKKWEPVPPEKWGRMSLMHKFLHLVSALGMLSSSLFDCRAMLWHADEASELDSSFALSLLFCCCYSGLQIPTERASVDQFPELDTLLNFSDQQQIAVQETIKELRKDKNLPADLPLVPKAPPVVREFLEDAGDSEDNSSDDDEYGRGLRQHKNETDVLHLSKFVEELPNCVILDIGFQVLLDADNWVSEVGRMQPIISMMAA